MICFQAKYSMLTLTFITEPAHLIAESIIAHKLSFMLSDLTRTEINAIFYDNAKNLFSLR